MRPTGVPRHSGALRVSTNKAPRHCVRVCSTGRQQLSSKTPTLYYDLLGVSPGAPAAVIKAAYRVLAKETHPDVNGAADAQEQFKLLTKAYEVLTDERQRREYDMFLEKMANARASYATSAPPAGPAAAPRAAPPPPPSSVIIDGFEVQVRSSARQQSNSNSNAAAAPVDGFDGFSPSATPRRRPPPQAPPPPTTWSGGYSGDDMEFLRSTAQAPQASQQQWSSAAQQQGSQARPHGATSSFDDYSGDEDLLAMLRDQAQAPPQAVQAPAPAPTPAPPPPPAPSQPQASSSSGAYSGDEDLLAMLRGEAWSTPEPAPELVPAPAPMPAPKPEQPQAQQAQAQAQAQAVPEDAQQQERQQPAAVPETQAAAASPQPPQPQVVEAPVVATGGAYAADDNFEALREQEVARPYAAQLLDPPAAAPPAAAEASTQFEWPAAAHPAPLEQQLQWQQQQPKVPMQAQYAAPPVSSPPLPVPEPTLPPPSPPPQPPQPRPRQQAQQQQQQPHDFDMYSDIEAYAQEQKPKFSYHYTWRSASWTEEDKAAVLSELQPSYRYMAEQIFGPGLVRLENQKELQEMCDTLDGLSASGVGFSAAAEALSVFGKGVRAEGPIAASSGSQQARRAQPVAQKKNPTAQLEPQVALPQPPQPQTVDMYSDIEAYVQEQKPKLSYHFTWRSQSWTQADKADVLSELQPSYRYMAEQLFGPGLARLENQKELQEMCDTLDELSASGVGFSAAAEALSVFGKGVR